MIEAPGIERSHALQHHGVALTLFVAPLLLGAAIEAALLLRASRGHARRWIASMHALAAACALAAAWVPHAWMLAAALGLAGTAGGVAAALGQGALVEAAPDRREGTMARWTLAGALGDLFAPVVVAGVAWFGGSWRVALSWIATAMLLASVPLWRASLPAHVKTDDDDDDDDGGPAGVRAALRHRGLMGWLAAAAACTLLDEILVAFAALHLRLDRGASEAAIGLAMSLWAAGCAVGLVATERLLVRVHPRRVLGVGAALCTVAALTWWALPGFAGATAGLVLLGLGSAPLYPIAKARAYAAVPGRAALVGAAAQLFVVADVFAPWALGLLADATGLRAALAALALGPALLLIAAIASRPWRG
ncbi:MAG: hypothetical protein K1X88_12830 [Nannocystaceae bacterium]|nr:hypothetical protein [Nannocystaceae bacterium]